MGRGIREELAWLRVDDLLREADERSKRHGATAGRPGAPPPVRAERAESMDLTPYLESVRSDLEAVAGSDEATLADRRTPGPRPGGVAATPDAGRARPGGPGAGRTAALPAGSTSGSRAATCTWSWRATSPSPEPAVAEDDERHGEDHAPAGREHQDPGRGASRPARASRPTRGSPVRSRAGWNSNSSSTSVSAGWATGSPASPRASRPPRRAEGARHGTDIRDTRATAPGDSHRRRLDPAHGHRDHVDPARDQRASATPMTSGSCSTMRVRTRRR